MIGLVGCAGSAIVIDWIPHRLLWLGVRTQTPRSADWFGRKDAGPILLGEELSYLSSGLGPVACSIFCC